MSIVLQDFREGDQQCPHWLQRSDRNFRSLILHLVDHVAFCSQLSAAASNEMIS